MRNELQTATRIIAEACRLAARVQDEIVSAGDSVLKADRSPVTVADLAVQTVVTARLAEAYPDDPLVAEEDPAPFAGELGPGIERRVLALVRSLLPAADSETVTNLLGRGAHPGGARGRFWVLDPIDGTKGFLRGEQYAVALALVENGQVVAGVVGCPNLPAVPGTPSAPGGCLFAAAAGGGASQISLDLSESRRIHVDATTDPGLASFCESVESGHSSHSAAARVAAALAITAPPRRVDGQTKYGVVARGEASIYLRLPTQADYREKIWDHAAGALIVGEAGGLVTHADGRPPDFASGRTLTNGSGLVVTNGRLHDAVLRALREL